MKGSSWSVLDFVLRDFGDLSAIVDSFSSSLSCWCVACRNL